MSISRVNRTESAVCQVSDTKDLQREQRQRLHARRLDFLRERPTLLGRLPDAGEMTADQAEALDQAVKEMLFWQLYANGLATKYVRASIRLLVQELRGER
jgi:hypothetical protein